MAVSIESSNKPIDYDLSKCYLKSAYGQIEPHQLSWLKETPKDLPLEEMHQRFKEDGYLHIKGLLDRDEILNLRKAYFEFMKPAKLCVEGKEDIGVFSFVDGHDQFAVTGSANFPIHARPDELSVYHKLVEESHNLPEYKKLLNNETLRNFVKIFGGWDEALLLERTMLRSNVPGASGGGIHFDYMFLRANDEGFLTTWIPLGDISPKGSGVIYLEDSIAIARNMEKQWQQGAMHLSEEERISAFNSSMTDGARCAADCSEFSTEKKRKWLVGNYEAGDIVLHDAFIIHTTAPNEDPDGIVRLSTDLRFCNPKKAVDPRWRNQWRVGDGV